MNTFALRPLNCEQIVVGPLANNSFLLTYQNQALLIDAADEPDRILRLIGNRKLTDVITTHQHHDHIGALAEVVKATGATPWCGQPDAAAIKRATGVECQTVWTNDHIRFATEKLGIIGLVGHTPGSICIVSESAGRPTHLFTGDSLFPGGVGKTHSDEDFRSLFYDVKTKLFHQFDDETFVHPGHGDSTTLGAERPHLDEWEARGW